MEEAQSNAEAFQAIEQTEGTRFTWNVWNPSPAKADTVPIAVHYNIKQKCPFLDYEPVVCMKCKGVLSPLAYVDPAQRVWTCSFCSGRNSLPNDLDVENMPELAENATTVEYALTKQSAFPPVFILIIDTSTYDEERHGLMIRSVTKAVDMLPDEAMIGVIQYGTNINVYSFTDEPLKTVYQFSGDFVYEKKNIRGMDDLRLFLVKKCEMEKEIKEVVARMKRDPFPVPNGFRANRCTGAAISFAVSFLEGPFRENPVKYLLFTQGPCTYGPGQVCHREIASEDQANVAKATEFYDEQAGRINDLGHSIDIIGETIADIGYEQMRPLISMTGGAIIIAQDFEERVVMSSLDMLYATDEGSLGIGFNAKIQIKSTPNIKARGFYGDGRQRGSGWSVGCISPTTNLTVHLEPTEAARANSYGYVQILTQFVRSDRRTVLRVTTFARLFSSDKVQLCDSFDEEAACVAQARIFCNHPFENIYDLETSIDKHLIRFTKRYAAWERNSPDSLSLPSTMGYYLNFMFFFRRSFVIQPDGVSQDESAYFKTLLYKLRVSDALKLIKPTLQCFTYQGDVFPTELSTEAMADDVILLMDSFHNVVQWNGLNIMSWIKDGLHKQSEFTFFRDTLDAAKAAGLAMLEERVPAPQYKVTSAGKSQERILVTYLCSSGGSPMHTQKIDYNRFYSALCKHIVSSE
ncbi:SEC23 [Enterospora canceri]|uniref:Protein transport protein SEC23 n=1 Tax=Enterospora canceri TaxID=1081671 RepID=A0A1Y1S5K2_9MICR|nr:SEC23 [Enterospora canceri]